MIKLRDYQEALVAAVETKLAAGVDRQMAVLPTGGGKTVCFSEIIRRRQDKPALILAHRDELLQQAADKLISVAPELGMSIGMVKAKHNEVGAPVVVASVQTLARQRRLEQLPKHFGTVIVDECHHAAADSYKRIIEYLDAELTLGVTATPERHDGRRLDKVFPEIVFARSIEQMIREGYLVAPRGTKITVDVDLSEIKQTAGDFQQDQLAEALEEAGAPGEVLQSWLEHGEDRKTLVFTPSVAMAHHTAEVFRQAGIKAEAVDGTTPKDERAQILHRLHTGDTTVVCNVGVLTEGFDEPSVSCIVLAAPTRSRARYTQIIGRGLRLHPGKTDCLVLDVVGTSDGMTIESLPALFGVDQLLDGETVIDAIDRETREAEARAREEEAEQVERDKEEEERLARRRRNAESIRFFGRDRMNWLELGDRWAISFRDSWSLVLWPEGNDQYAVLLVKGQEQTFKRLAGGLDIGYAMGVAEESIRTHGSRLLADKKAPWREDPPTKGQRGKLYYLGLPVPSTKGEAADLITQAELAAQLDRIAVALEQQAEIERQHQELDEELDQMEVMA